MAQYLPDVKEFINTIIDPTSQDAVIPRAFDTVRNWQTFEWTTGVTPFSHPSWPIGALIAYVITIYSLQRWMSNRERFKLSFVARYHNLFLCAWSLAMCVGASWVLVDALMHKGYSVSDLVCDNVNNQPGALMRGPLAFWAWSYHISKYYELLDTVLAVLRRKPLTTLHVYHHMVMVPTTWMWCHNHLTMHWFAIVVNCFVHVVMYYYYAQASIMKYRPWWRQFITVGQILQFIAAMGTSMSWQFMSFTNFRWLSEFPFMAYDGVVCQGNPWLVLWSQFLTMSLLILFSHFFIQVYIFKKDRKLGAQTEAEKQQNARSSSPNDGTNNGRPTTPAKPIKYD